MRRLRKHRPSPAMVVALIALCVALSGGAYAAITLPANVVGTKQLKTAAVTEAKLNSGAVTSLKVKDYSLLAKDFKPGQLPAGPRGAKGDTGPAGPAGPQGAKGDKGDAGATGAQGAKGDAGQAGEQGAKGDTGQAGTPGERGPSDAYVASSGFTNAPLAISVTVPAGLYVVNAKADPYNPTAGTLEDPLCVLLGSGGGDAGYGGSVPSGKETNIAVQSWFNLSSGGTITLSCSGASFRFGNAKLTAIQVGALH